MASMTEAVWKENEKTSFKGRTGFGGSRTFGGPNDEFRPEALVTGIGAPRSLNDGAALLGPLADGWNAEAAMLVAQARAAGGDSVGGYAMALRGLAGGAQGSITLADELERELGIDEVLATQEATIDAWPGAGEATGQLEAMIGSGDVSGLRRMANRAATGKDMPRDYVTAYFLASLAAAGGDRGAANLRDRLDNQLDSDAWNQAASAAASMARWQRRSG